MSDLVLTPTEVGLFQDALLSAFNRSELESLVYIQLGEDLDQIVEDGSFAKVVLDLIKWANKQGKTEALLRAARAENPGNSVLRAFDERIQSRLSSSPAPSGPGPVLVTIVLTPALRAQLIEALLKVPTAQDFGGRTALLAGIPGNLNRYPQNARLDLEAIVDQLNGLGRLGSGVWPLLNLIDNALPYVAGFQVEGDLKAVRQALAQGYKEA